MIIPVVVPRIGESVSEAQVAEWHVADGAQVSADTPLCTLESDKAALEIQAERAGQLRILQPKGAVVAVGAVLGEITVCPTAVVSNLPGETAAPSCPPPAPVFNNTRPVPLFDGATEAAKARLTPTAARILEQAAVPAGAVRGTGVHGRVTKADALGAVKSLSEPSANAETPPGAGARIEPPPPPVPSGPPTPSSPAAAETQTARPEAPPPSAPAASSPAAFARFARREPMSPLRRTIARRLLQARQETAMLTTFNEVDMSAVQTVRRLRQDEFQKRHGVKLGFMSFFARAVCLALKEIPVINASAGADFIEYHDGVDLAVAVSIPRGLVTPVVQDAHTLGVPALEKAIQALARKARDNKLSLDEMSGGTFTLTNGGIFGSVLSTPLINPPQSAILGMHAIQDRPVVRDGAVVVRPMMNLALSYDHRIIDGRESVMFVMRVKEWLEGVAPTDVES